VTNAELYEFYNRNNKALITKQSNQHDIPDKIDKVFMALNV